MTSLKNNSALIVLDLEFSLMEINIFKKGVHKRSFKTFEIIEVGGVFVNAQKEENTFGYFVKPKYKNYQIEERIKNLTGINESDLKNGVLFKEVYQKLKSIYIKNETPILTWGISDMPVFKKMCEKYELEYFIKEEDIIDVSLMFHSFYSINDIYPFSLEKALSYLKIKHKLKHRATSDAVATLSIYKKILEDEKNYEDWDELN